MVKQQRKANLHKNNVYKNWERKRYDLSPEERNRYRQISQAAYQAKQLAQQGKLVALHPINTPRLDPLDLMPQLPQIPLRTLSLFTGGGGLDLGFERAGFRHQGAYELIPICGETLRTNHPEWQIFSGPEQGDVAQVDWQPYRGKIDLMHGGPPCQPFSVAGGQIGEQDERNLWGEFIRAINTIEPQVFVAENVPGLLSKKFANFVQTHILKKLPCYTIKQFELQAADFGIPQVRRRVLFVGFRSAQMARKFQTPTPTHHWLPPTEPQQLSLNLDSELPACLATMGVRQALGLPNLGYDTIAPTLRSGFTGKRNTTSVLNSAASQKTWSNLQIWPNGVQRDRQSAAAFPAKNEHFRLSVQDCAVIQGFPERWQFSGAVYQILGQIGNSVCPPVAYQVAKAIRAMMI
ncbi:MAG: DNA (cytosine-5-)-methyltransferase [Cyanobacteria bacterium P01_G01_bin.54]